MRLEDLSPKLQEEVRALKHGSYSIEADVDGALDEAEDLEDFKDAVHHAMICLVLEAKNTINVIVHGTPERLSIDPASIVREGTPLPTPINVMDNDDYFFTYHIYPAGNIPNFSYPLGLNGEEIKLSNEDNAATISKIARAYNEHDEVHQALASAAQAFKDLKAGNIVCQSKVDEFMKKYGGDK